MVNSTQFADRDLQMSFEWEFPPDTQQETTEYEIELRRWEGEGGAIGRKESDGE